MRRALLALLAIAACTKAPPADEHRGEPRADPPAAPAPAKGLEQFKGLIPAHGALVQECGLASQGPECVRVIFDADAHVVTYRPMQPLGGTVEKTVDLGAAAGGELWARAKRVLAAGHWKAHDVSDLTLDLAIHDGDDDQVATETNGPFADRETQALVEALIALAK